MALKRNREHRQPKLYAPFKNKVRNCSEPPLLAGIRSMQKTPRKMLSSLYFRKCKALSAELARYAHSNSPRKCLSESTIL